MNRTKAEALRRHGPPVLLLLLALLAMVGDATGVTVLKGLGLASAASPLPKVFSDVRGHETFAADFTLLVTGADGGERRLAITPELYDRIRGPYNRRNVYGAALAYAPRLPDSLWQPPFCHGLAPGGPLRAELGLPADALRVRVEIVTRTRGRSDRWLLDPPCP